MPIETSYTDLRQHLASYIDKVVDDCETVVVKRRDGASVALIDAHELEQLQETAHLLRSPRSARRLLEAMDDADRGEGVQLGLEELRQWLVHSQPSPRIAEALAKTPRG